MNLEDGEDTPITAQALQAHTDALEAADAYLAEVSADKSYYEQAGFLGANRFSETLEQGGFNSSGTSIASANACRCVGYMKVNANEKFTFTYESTKEIQIAISSFATPNTERINTSGLQNSGYTLTTPEGTKYIRCAFFANEAITPSDIKNIMMARGEKAKPYTPYARPNTELTNDADNLKMLGWTLPEELSGMNYIDGAGVFHQRVDRVDLGALSNSKITDNTFDFLIEGLKTTNTRTVRMYCKGYENKHGGEPFDTSWNKVCFNVISNNKSYARFIDLSYNDAAAFKASLAGVYLYYELAAEKTWQVDGGEIVAELQAQVDEEIITSQITARSNISINPTRTRAIKNGNTVDFYFQASTTSELANGEASYIFDIREAVKPAFLITGCGFSSLTNVRTEIYVNDNGSIMVFPRGGSLPVGTAIYGTLRWHIGK